MTAPSPPLHELLDEDFAWTPRQREVLGLIARGYTNNQIAAELGVSLDGAKWHVREVLTKLGMHSRDEAAEYWRAYNGWPRRLRRTVAGFAAPGLFKWAGGAAVVGGIGAGVAAVVMFLPLGNGNEAPGAGDTTPSAQETSAPDETPTPQPGDVTGLYTEPGDREPDEVLTLPALNPGFAEPGDTGAIFDIGAGETIDIGDAWLPQFNPQGTVAAFVVGDLGPGATGMAEVRVVDLATREITTVHTFPANAASLSWDAGPMDGSPPFWWWDDGVIAAYVPGAERWDGVDVATGDATGLEVSFSVDDEGNGWWDVVDEGAGLSETRPQATGYPRADNAADPHPPLSSWGTSMDAPAEYVIEHSGGDATSAQWLVRDAATRGLLTRLDAHAVHPVDAQTILVFAAPHGPTLQTNLFTVDLDSLEAELVGTGAFPPSQVSAGHGSVVWTERACGVRDRDVPVSHPDYVIEGPGDAFIYDRATGALTRIDAGSARSAGAPALFVTVVDERHFAVAFDSHDVHALVDRETMEAAVVLPIPARNWTADRSFAAAGRVADHHGRCTGSPAVVAMLSALQELQGIAELPVLRVAGSETCLNVRDEPSLDGEILRCYVDGAAMFVRDAEAPDGWVAVRTLDGREGWASSDYLVER